jgi:hypothetical protein
MDEDDPNIKVVKFNGKELHIKRFFEHQMVKNPSILMMGKRGNGKSWICRSLLRYLSKIPCGIVIAPTEKVAEEPFYEEFVPNSYIYYEFSPKIIEKLLDRQGAMIEKMKSGKNAGKKIDPRTFILMDDCLSQKKSWINDTTTHELLFNGRHYQITYILTSQTTMGVSSELRNNFDYVFILASDNHADMKKIHLHYAGMFPTYDSFRHTFSKLTEDFCCMVVVNRGARANFSDKIFWYKAINDKNEDFVGCGQYVRNHKKNYNEEWRKKNKFCDKIEEMSKKK